MAASKNKTSGTRSSSGSKSKKSSGSAGNRRKGSTKSKNYAAARKKKKNSNSGILSDVIVIVALVLCVFMILGNMGLCGAADGFFNIFTFGLFGALGYISPIVLLVLVFLAVWYKDRIYCLLKIVGCTAEFILLCTMAWLLTLDKVSANSLGTYYSVALEGHCGGGAVGAFLMIMLKPLGVIVCWILLVTLFIILLLAITDFSLLKYMGYMGEKISDDRAANREIRQMKDEETRIYREQALEENRRRNAERMLKAHQNLEQAVSGSKTSIKETKEKSDRQYVSTPIPIERNTRHGVQKSAGEPKEVENPLKSVIEKNIKKPDTVKTADNVVVDKETGEIIENTSPKKKKEESSLSDIINRTINRGNERRAEAKPMEPPKINIPETEPLKKKPESLEEVKSVTSVRQMNISDLEKPANIEKTSDDEWKPEYNNGMPVHKPFGELNADDDIVVETATGKIIHAERGNSAAKKVEAPGHETDPHGTGQKYDDEPEEQITIEPPKKEYIFPPIDLMKKGKPQVVEGQRTELEDTAGKLVEFFKNFNINVTISDIVCGPTVTRYELTPDMGVKISKIVGLQDDIMLALAAKEIRIEAPIPGKAAIGIEVPNKETSPVMLRDLIESDEFKNTKSKLAFACGRDIGGNVIIGDVAKYPHVLIAGATGSGKSVCINSIIVSILYHAKPSEVRLLMIDPKVVELKIYNNIPHLLRPVVTDPKQAAGALSWAVGEMTRRYKLFADHNVRDLKGYNEKIITEKGETARDKCLPQIVIIVDEMADLMMTASNEVEDSIMHLAQMARAAGMHLILATQRPSVNVITGVIKANIPSRIALSVSSNVDSRTIIDTVGAEKLLGHGDMLYLPAGLSKPIRVQGTYISDGEIESIVKFITEQGDVSGGGYDNNIDLAQIAAMTDGQSQYQADNGKDELDPLFNEAGALIVGVQKASIGMLQRKFRIGFNRAARIMDQLAEEGVVGEEEGTKPRAVLMTKEQFEAYVASR